MVLSRTLMPSLQELTAFEAAGRHGSFTKAAEELSLTQSAISKQVRQLEDTLGVTLFNRVNGRVVLTTLGEDYTKAARRILRDCEASTHAVIASGGSDATLKVAVLPTFASRWLIARLPHFLAEHPTITISLVTALEPFDFQEKVADVAIHYGTPSWARGAATYLCEETIIAVASPGYATKHNLKSAADFEGATLIQLATRPTLWGTWLANAATQHPHPYRGPIFDQFAMTIQAAIASIGIALSPTYLIEHELRDGVLVRLSDAVLPGIGAYYAVVPLEKHQDPLVTAFVTWLVDEASKSVAARMKVINGGAPDTRR